MVELSGTPRRWVVAGAAAVPAIVAIAALRLVPLAPPLRLTLSLFGTLGTFLFGAGLFFLLRARNNTMTVQLAAAVIGAYTAFLLTDTVLHAAITRVELGQLGTRDLVLPGLEVWIIILDMIKGFLNPLATFLFSLNLLAFSRLGLVLGVAGLLISVAQFGIKVTYFPQHLILVPLFVAGLVWSLGVAFLMARAVRIRRHG
jgi:hypothetical protein